MKIINVPPDGYGDGELGRILRKFNRATLNILRSHRRRTRMKWVHAASRWLKHLNRWMEKDLGHAKTTNK